MDKSKYYERIQKLLEDFEFDVYTNGWNDRCLDNKKKEEEAYIKGFEKGSTVNQKMFKDKFKAGCDAIWECARKINDYNNSHMMFEIFDDDFYYGGLDTILKKYSALEVLEKIKNYEINQTKTNCTNYKSCTNCKYNDLEEEEYPCSECTPDVIMYSKWAPIEETKEE